MVEFWVRLSFPFRNHFHVILICLHIPFFLSGHVCCFLLPYPPANFDLNCSTNKFLKFPHKEINNASNDFRQKILANSDMKSKIYSGWYRCSRLKIQKKGRYVFTLPKTFKKFQSVENHIYLNINYYLYIFVPVF